MADISAWSPVDESNTAAPPNGWPENMQCSGVNNSARAMMGAIRRNYDTVTAQFAALPTQYLPLTGGTVNGDLTVNGTVNADYLYSEGNGAIVGNLTVNGTITGGAVNSNGTITGATVNSNGNMNVTGTITGGSVVANVDVSAGRDMGVAGTVYANGVDCSGRVNASFYDCDGNRVLDTSSGATVLYKGGNVQGVQLQNAATYYDNNSHTFRNSGSSITFSIDISGNVSAAGQVQGSSIYSRGSIDAAGAISASGAISAGGSISASGVINSPRFQGGPGGAAQLQTFNTNNGVNFRWDTAGTGQLAYRVDESVEKYIAATVNFLDSQYAYPGGGPTNAVLGGHDFPGIWYYSFIDYTSDERIKTNVAPTQVDALAVLQQVPVDEFDIKPEVVDTFRALRGIHGREVATSDHVAIGLVAQKLMPLIPEAVYVGPQPGDNPLPEDCHNITLPAITPYLIRAVQQLAARLEILERER